jgi:lipopolysaccharide transport system ATP-binding protein
VASDRYAFALSLPKLALLPGKYFFRAHALDPEGVRLFDNVECPLVVTGETREIGLVRLEHRWTRDGHGAVAAEPKRE